MYARVVGDKLNPADYSFAIKLTRASRKAVGVGDIHRL